MSRLATDFESADMIDFARAVPVVSLLPESCRCLSRSRRGYARAMSRAFVRETDGAEVPQDLPERPVSSHPNFVTPRGRQQIEDRIHELEAAREEPKRAEDKDALAR